MSIKSELTKTASYLRNIRSTIQTHGGQVSATAGLKDLPEAINSIPSGSSNTFFLGYMAGTITEVAEQDLQGLTSIRNYAFYYLKSLTSVVIPNSITSIGIYAFGYCTGLTNVTIGSSVIGNYAFYNCTGLMSVTIGSDVTSIGNYAFDKCTGLTNVYITDIASWCGISCSNKTDTPLNYAANFYLNGNLVTELIIPDSVTSIGGYAFYKRTNLTSVVIPNSITSIGDSAFSNCTGLTSVVIPNNVTSIGSNVFNGCTGLTSVTIGNGVTSFGTSTFSNCTSLTSIEIPNSVTSIASYMFNGCTGLTSVTIPNSVTTISSFAFNKCTGCLEYDFTAASMVPTLSNKNAFTGINSSCQIKVPASLYDEWIVATNWATYANYIVAV